MSNRNMNTLVTIAVLGMLVSSMYTRSDAAIGSPTRISRGSICAESLLTGLGKVIDDSDWYALTVTINAIVFRCQNPGGNASEPSNHNFVVGEGIDAEPSSGNEFIVEGKGRAFAEACVTDAQIESVIPDANELTCRQSGWTPLPETADVSDFWADLYQFDCSKVEFPESPPNPPPTLADLQALCSEKDHNLYRCFGPVPVGSEYNCTEQ